MKPSVEDSRRSCPVKRSIDVSFAAILNNPIFGDLRRSGTHVMSLKYKFLYRYYWSDDTVTTVSVRFYLN